MYKAIIADDEEMVRRGLVNHFDWKGHGIEVAGVFGDGASALEFVRENKVDIIVTDVRMARMDGITLAKNVLDFSPDVKIVFISGYADVDYLKDALKMKAVDYILKSIDIDELDTVITKVVGMLERQQSESAAVDGMRRRLEQSMPLLRRQRLCSLLQDSDESEEEIQQSIEFLDIPLNSRSAYAALVLRLQPKSKWLAVGNMQEKECINFDLAIEALFGRVLAEWGVKCFFKEHSFEYIALLDMEREENRSESNISQYLQQRMWDEMNLEVMVGISEPFQGLRSIHAAYLRACERISQGYFAPAGGESGILAGQRPVLAGDLGGGYSDSAEGMVSCLQGVSHGNSYMLREQAEKEICESILNGNISVIRSALKRAVAGLRMLPQEEEQQNFMVYLLFLPTSLMENIQAENMGPYTSYRKLMAGFLQCRGLGEQEAMLASVYEELAKHLQRIRAPRSNTAIKRVQEIIAAQYMEQLSVASLAEAVYLTPTYLCVLFKQVTGKTINEYITQERMNKAKEFLSQTNIRLYDVCYRVGYFSPSYFSRIFKKYTGQTPGEYREKIMLNSRPERG